ncbi:ATP-independent RNA helicase dbpA domain protein [Yersinia enterocolitica]|nr:ATP-independent RNA helicase dbpA domain protein [Yersinia enterocolitica]KGA75369.1 ATP-independent RNA helicase dbpA domain protein [Yersinia enterocolitica]
MGKLHSNFMQGEFYGHKYRVKRQRKRLRVGCEAENHVILPVSMQYSSGNGPISGIIAAKSCARLQAIAAIPSCYKSYCREHNFLFFPDTAC